MIAKKFVLGRLLLRGLFTTIAFAAAGAASAVVFTERRSAFVWQGQRG